MYKQYCLVAHELVTLIFYVYGLFRTIQLEQTISAYVILLVKFIEIGHLKQCFSTFVRPRTGKFFFHKRGPGPNRFTRQYLTNCFLSSDIKLT